MLSENIKKTPPFRSECWTRLQAEHAQVLKNVLLARQ